MDEGWAVRAQLEGGGSLACLPCLCLVTAALHMHVYSQQLLGGSRPFQLGSRPSDGTAYDGVHGGQPDPGRRSQGTQTATRAKLKVSCQLPLPLPEILVAIILLLRWSDNIKFDCQFQFFDLFAGAAHASRAWTGPQKTAQLATSACFMQPSFR